MANNFEKNDTRNAKRTASKMLKRELRISNKGKVQFNKSNKADVKAGKSTGVKVTSSTIRAAKTNSAKMPSVASKANAKNKMKANPRAMSSPTSGYGKLTKPKGR